jgi:dihydrofolate reductase
MIISIVVAIAENNAIGKDNQLLWHLPADLKFFKNTTSGKSIIMGRKTYESIGRPLPNRRNIVISTQKGLMIEGCEVVHSIEEAIEKCKGEGEICIIGGGNIYKQAFHLCNKIYLTLVHHSFDADTFFPELNPSEWKEVWREDHQADEKNKFNYSFIELVRK